MESKKFSFLLEDIEGSRTNSGKVEILSCYVAQKFTVDQISRLVKSISRASSRLKVLKLLVEELESCDLRNALKIIEVISMSTSNKEIQMNCLEELVKYRKLNVDESGSASLAVLFVDTEFHDKATYLLNKIRKPPIKHTASMNSSSDPHPIPQTTSFASQNAATSSTLPAHPMSQATKCVPPPAPYPYRPSIPPAYNHAGGVPAANTMNIGFIHPSNNFCLPQPQQEPQTSPQSAKPPAIGFTL